MSSEGGKYGYNEDDFRDYVRSERAHNIVRVAGKEIRPGRLPLIGSQLKSLDKKQDHFAITGSIERVGLFKQDRTILYWPGKQIEIRDALTAGKSLEYVSSLHLARDIIPRLTQNGFQATLKGGVTMTATVEQGDCKIDMYRGQKNPVMGWESTGYLQMAPSSVITATCAGKSRSINWLVTFSPAA